MTNIEIVHEFEESCMAAGYHLFDLRYHRIMEECDYLVSVRNRTGWGKAVEIVFAKETGIFLLVNWVIRGRIFHIVTTWEGSVNAGPHLRFYDNLKHPAEVADTQLKNELDRIQRQRETRVKRRERCKEIGRKLVRQGADPNDPEMAGWLNGAFPVAVEDHERDAVREHWDQTYRKAYTGKVQVRT